MFESRKQAVFRCFCRKSIYKNESAPNEKSITGEQFSFGADYHSPCHQFQELNTLKNKHKQKVKGINSHASKGQVSCHRVSAFPKGLSSQWNASGLSGTEGRKRLHVFAKVVYKKADGLGFHSFDDTPRYLVCPVRIEMGVVGQSLVLPRISTGRIMHESPLLPSSPKASNRTRVISCKSIKGTCSRSATQCTASG